MPQCMSGDICEEEAIPSSTFPDKERFCELHQGQLDEIRGILMTGAWDRNVRNKEGTIERYCETPGCPNRPLYAGDYCVECNGDD